MDRAEPAFLLHVDFEAQARLTPGAIALHFAGATITYAELGQRMARVAGALSRRGIGAGCYVGLHVDRSIDYVASVLGILKANAAVVPLPPAYPRARLADILEFAGLDAVVDHPDTPLAPVPGTRVLRFADLVAEAHDAGTLASGNPDQPAFVLASSGSTGKPKLIVRSHRSFYHRLCWTWANHPYGPDERCVQKSTMTTTHAIYELFEPLLRGVPTLVLGDPESRDLQGLLGDDQRLVDHTPAGRAIRTAGLAGIPGLRRALDEGRRADGRVRAPEAGRACDRGLSGADVDLLDLWQHRGQFDPGLRPARVVSTEPRTAARPTDLAGRAGLRAWPRPGAGRCRHDRPAAFRRHGALYGVLQGSDADGLRLRPFARVERTACTTRTTRFGSRPTATSSTSAAPITRSRCAASAWTSRKSSARCCCIRRSATPRSCSTRAMQGTPR